MRSHEAGQEIVIRASAPGRRALRGYLVHADGTEVAPGVVVIHEIFGLNENIRSIADRFGEAGYSALAVDLFSGGIQPLCLLRIFYGLLLRPFANGTLAELQDALQFLKNDPGVDPDRVGVIGFCMGGSYALQLACVKNGPRVASVFYGQNPRPLDAVARACPIVGSYPEPDFTAGQARSLEKALIRHSVPHDIKIYSGARHSFFNDASARYDAEASADAWGRTLAFFNEYLRSGATGRESNGK
jgi:carboxymethylenebutenolidase